jgi:hypothetical protein
VRRINFTLVLVMLALLPLRGLTAVTIGDCGVGQHGAAHQHESHGHHDGHAPPSHDDAKHDHEHCASASFVASAISLPLPPPSKSDRPLQRSRFVAGFVADQLDPPPLGL